MDIFRKVEQGISGLFTSEDEKHSHTHEGSACHDLHAEHRENRFHSFAPQTSGHAKWHVDGCSYFWALSEALEGQNASPEDLLALIEIQASKMSKLTATGNCRGPGVHLHLGLVAVS